MRKALWAGAIALAVATGPAAADVEDRQEWSFDVDTGARVSLENVNGDITVTSGPAGVVAVVAHRKAGTQEYLDGLEIVVDADRDYVRIETRHPKSSGGWFSWGSNGSGSVAYKLTVPADANLDGIETVNGDVSISGVGGTVKAATVNGGLDVTDLAGDVGLETVNGSIEARFTALSGDQRVDAEAVNGKIRLRLPGDASARVTAETVNGSIVADDFGLEPEKGFVGRELSGDIGGGSARVSLDTVNGSIRIEKN
jgi:DUF4097 and DUF4098 domain-containing protein YvlB